MTAPNSAGSSTVDRVGCADRDGDSYSSAGDPFPDDARSGRTETVITAGTTPMATILMRSPTTPVSGKTAMAMATAIAQVETTAMPSQANQRNGVTEDGDRLRRQR